MYIRANIENQKAVISFVVVHVKILDELFHNNAKLKHGTDV